MEPILSAQEVVDVLTTLESGRYSKEAAISNIDNTFQRICSACKVDFSKMKSRDLQILDAVMTALENKIREHRKEVPWMYQDIGE